MWRMGKVEKLIVGKHRKIRGAELTVISKKGHRTTASRPVQKLIPFEIARETEVQDEITENENEVDKNEISDHGELGRKRSKRNATRRGKELRRLRDIYS